MEYVCIYSAIAASAAVAVKSARLRTPSTGKPVPWFTAAMLGALWLPIVAAVSAFCIGILFLYALALVFER